VFVFIVKLSFFELNRADDSIDVSQRYIDKSDPYLIVVCTPDRPEDMLHRITEHPEDLCIYKRMYLPYTVGLGDVFSDKDIMKQYRVDRQNIRILMDASVPSIVSALKSNMNERTDYLSLLGFRKKNNV
jgi:hypothetical protein